MRLAVIGLATVMVLCGCGAARPVVTVAPGLHPRMDPAAAERIAREAVEPRLVNELIGRRGPDALSITAIHGGSTIAAWDSGVSWIVEFRGAFSITQGTLRHATTRVVSRAWVQVADDYGTVLAVNFGD